MLQGTEHLQLWLSPCSVAVTKHVAQGPCQRQGLLGLTASEGCESIRTGGTAAGSMDARAGSWELTSSTKVTKQGEWAGSREGYIISNSAPRDTLLSARLHRLNLPSSPPAGSQVFTWACKGHFLFKPWQQCFELMDILIFILNNAEDVFRYVVQKYAQGHFKSCWVFYLNPKPKLIEQIFFFL